jgi:hypothetical protein
MPLLMDQPIREEEWTQHTAERDGHAFHEPAAPDQTEDAGPWEPAVKKILSFKELEDDWDGFGAKMPSREMLECAIGLAYLLCDRGVPAPSRVAPGLEGEVIFEWQDPDGTYADVEIVRPFFAEVMLIEPGKPAKHWTLPTE